MYRLFNTNYNHNSLDFVVFILRVAIALLMLSHGMSKLDTLLAGGEIKFPDPVGVGSVLSLVFTVFAEVFCSALILIGLATRLAVLPLIVTMVVAVFVIHGADGMKEKELGLHYILAYVVLLFSGSGRFSIDSLISRKATRSKRGY
ncbi:DoxX family protein [Pedobacter sp. AW31-3R]|uniref:DoxX family protein n=1 Tax=Pedobacter sp. AW31-3R TaxID=3445781 RepID=UPI003F9F66F5